MATRYRQFTTSKHDYVISYTSSFKGVGVFVYRVGGFPDGEMFADVCYPEKLIQTLHELKKKWERYEVSNL